MNQAHDEARILLVDDDAMQVELIKQVLASSKSGVERSSVTVAATGAECLSQDLKSFDLILLDYYLPDCTGLDLLGRIRGETDAPVIVVTSESDAELVSQIISRGAQDYIVKLGEFLLAIPVMVRKNLDQYRIRQDKQRLEDELEAAMIQLKVKNVQLEESLDKLEHLATTDCLTGLMNRRRFNESLTRCYAQAVRYEFDLCCCMCDLDGYKDLNDTYGHQLGDEVLILTGQIIRSSVRSSDITCRWGGDEFLLLLPYTAVDQGLLVCRRVCGALADAASAHRKLNVPVTMSVGIASLSENEPDGADELITMADEALYAAKGRGKNQIVAYGDIECAPVR